MANDLTPHYPRHKSAVRILLVDDGAPIMQSLFSFLKGVGYHVEIADGLRALGLLEYGRHHLVFIDVSSGMALFRAIRQEWPASLVLAITDYEGMNRGIESMEAGAIEYLVKPLVDEEICAAIDRAMLEQTPLPEDDLRERILGLRSGLQHGPRWDDRRRTCRLRRPPIGQG